MLFVWSLLCNNIIPDLACPMLFVWSLLCNNNLIPDLACPMLFVWTLLCNNLIPDLACPILFVWTLLCNNLIPDLPSPILFVWTLLCNNLIPDLAWPILFVWTLLCLPVERRCPNAVLCSSPIPPCTSLISESVSCITRFWKSLSNNFIISFRLYLQCWNHWLTNKSFKEIFF